MTATALNDHARQGTPPGLTERGYTVREGTLLGRGLLGRVRTTVAGRFARPGLPVRVIVAPPGIRLTPGRLAECLAAPEASPYPVYLLDPPRVPGFVDGLSKVALACACLYGLWGGVVGVALPSLGKAAGFYYGGNMATPQRLQAVTQIASERPILNNDEGSERDRTRAFHEEMRRLAP